MSSVSEEDRVLVIENIIKKYGDSLPNPEQYPRIFKTLIKHELFYIAREREGSSGAQ